jgi:hypothetical protein
MIGFNTRGSIHRIKLLSKTGLITYKHLGRIIVEGMKGLLFVALQSSSGPPENYSAFPVEHQFGPDKREV